jgi:hypothetical protein
VSQTSRPDSASDVRLTSSIDSELIAATSAATSGDTGDAPSRDSSVDETGHGRLLGRSAFVALAVVIAVVGLVARWWLLNTPQGALNADEAVTGLGAIDALDGRFDVVIPGAAYTANFESYLFAPVVALFGPYVTPLKAMPIILWACGTFVLFRFVRSLAGSTSAAVAAAMLWLVPGAAMVVSTRAYLAYSGGIVWSTAALWAISRAATDQPGRWRNALLAGVLAGCALYAHPLYFSTLGGAALVVTWYRRRDLRGWWLPAGAGALAALSPFLLWNVAHGFPSLEPTAVTDTTYLERLRGVFVAVWPRALGLRDFAGAWVLGRPVTIVVMAVVVALAGIGLRRLFALGPAGRTLAAAVIGAPMLMSLLSATGYVADGRYAVLFIAPTFAAVAIGLVAVVEWLAVRRPAARKAPHHRRVVILAAALAAWCGVLLAPYQLKVVGTKLGDPNAGMSAVVARLRAAEVTKVSADYWTAIPITYLTDAEIPTAVVGFPIRYPHYQQIVESSDPREVAFVYSPGLDLPFSLRMPVDQYAREVVAGYTLYLPLDPG